MTAGKQVSREQVVCGVTFVYNAPPKRKVPLAASLASTPLASGCTLPPSQLKQIQLRIIISSIRFSLCLWQLVKGARYCSFLDQRSLEVPTLKVKCLFAL